MGLSHNQLLLAPDFDSLSLWPFFYTHKPTNSFLSSFLSYNTLFKAECRSQNTSTTFPRTTGKVSFLNYHKYSFIKCLATAYMNFYLSTSDTNFLTTNWLIFLPVPHPLGTVTEATHFKVHFSVLAPISIVTTGQLSHWSNNVFCQSFFHLLH